MFVARMYVWCLYMYIHEEFIKTFSELDTITTNHIKHIQVIVSMANNITVHLLDLLQKSNLWSNTISNIYNTLRWLLVRLVHYTTSSTIASSECTTLKHAKQAKCVINVLFLVTRFLTNQMRCLLIFVRTDPQFWLAAVLQVSVCCAVSFMSGSSACFWVV